MAVEEEVKVRGTSGNGQRSGRSSFRTSPSRLAPGRLGPQTPRAAGVVVLKSAQEVDSLVKTPGVAAAVVPERSYCAVRDVRPSPAAPAG